MVYLEVGRRLGLNLYGVSFPTHFLVKAVDERGELIIDPFYDGTILTLDEIRARLTQIYGQPVELHPAMLKAVGARHILARMLRNLKNIYLSGVGLDARAVGARSHPDARAALARRAGRARRLCTSASNASRPRSTTSRVFSRRRPSIPRRRPRARP